MIVINKITIKDPSTLTPEQLVELRSMLFNSYPKIHIPQHITSNKEKKEYKAGFLNELFILAFPDETKERIYRAVNIRFDIFVEKRQYLNLMHEYSQKKYSVFIKN